MFDLLDRDFISLSYSASSFELIAVILKNK